MAGLAALALIGMYVSVGVYIVKRAPSTWAKAACALALLLIPSADAVLGRVYLRELCSNEAGPQVSRPVEGVDGFYSAFADRHLLDRYNYSFVEGLNPNGSGWVRYARSGDRIDAQPTANLKSLYEYKFVQGNIEDIYMRDEYRILVRDTGEILGKFVNILYAGGLVERMAAALVAGRGNGGVCFTHVPVRTQEQFIATVLRPKKQ